MKPESQERNEKPKVEATGETSEEKDTIVRPIIEGWELRGFKHVPIANVNPIIQGVGGEVAREPVVMEKVSCNRRRPRLRVHVCH